MTRNNFLVVLLLLCYVKLSAQTDYVRWEKVNNYLIINRYVDTTESLFLDKCTTHENKVISIAEILIKFYKITISDFDGDNCKFHPSCSEFFVEATRLTNPLISVLLFFDRLTRDSNIFSSSEYKIFKDRYFDPPTGYIFNSAEVIEHKR